MEKTCTHMMGIMERESVCPCPCPNTALRSQRTPFFQRPAASGIHPAHSLAMQLPNMGRIRARSLTQLVGCCVGTVHGSGEPLCTYITSHPVCLQGSYLPHAKALKDTQIQTQGEGECRFLVANGKMQLLST